MAKVIGCIGYGNMGSAIMSGFGKTLDKSQWSLAAYDVMNSRQEAMRANGIQAAESAADLAQKADILIFAVKPQHMPQVLDVCQPQLGSGKIAISIAAGIGLATLRNQLGGKCGVARCMPTTTAKAGAGVFAFCFDPVNLEPQWQDEILKLFAHIGHCQILPETQFTNFTALIGAGPAYIFQMLQALTQAGVTLGFQPHECRAMLLELLGGCAALGKNSDAHFSQLRDDVCSPAGITIAGINELDRAAFNGVLIDAVLAAADRGKEMES